MGTGGVVNVFDYNTLQKTASITLGITPINYGNLHYSKTLNKIYLPHNNLLYIIDGTYKTFISIDIGSQASSNVKLNTESNGMVYITDTGTSGTFFKAFNESNGYLLANSLNLSASINSLYYANPVTDLRYNRAYIPVGTSSGSVIDGNEIKIVDLTTFTLLTTLSVFSTRIESIHLSKSREKLHVRCDAGIRTYNTTTFDLLCTYAGGSEGFVNDDSEDYIYMPRTSFGVWFGYYRFNKETSTVTNPVSADGTSLGSMPWIYGTIYDPVKQYVFTLDYGGNSSLSAVAVFNDNTEQLVGRLPVASSVNSIAFPPPIVPMVLDIVI